MSWWWWYRQGSCRNQRREREGWQVAGVGLGIPDGGDGGGRQADGVGVAGGEPQAGAQRVTGRSKPGIK